MFLVAVTGCNDDEMLTLQPVEHGNIYLSVAVDERATTRAPYKLTAPTTSKPLDVDVWASTEKYVFKHVNGMNGSNDDGKVSLHATARFQSGEPQLLNQAIYNSITKPIVYFVSMHPRGWTTDDGTNAKFTINGSQDVLFAPQIYGTYATEYGKTPQLHFRHLLTWLSFELKAADEAAALAWGKIKKMEITSSDGVTIDLSSAAYTEETTDGKTVYKYNPAGYQFDNETTLPVYYRNPANATETDYTFESKFSETGGYALVTEAKEIAYVMCAPVNAVYEISDGMDGKVKVPEYKLTITAENRKDPVQVPIDLKIGSGSTEADYFAGSTMGKKFTVQLNFKLGNTIVVSAEMNEWQPGGIINKDVTE